VKEKIQVGNSAGLTPIKCKNWYDTFLGNFLNSIQNESISNRKRRTKYTFVLGLWKDGLFRSLNTRTATPQHE